MRSSGSPHRLRILAGGPLHSPRQLLAVHAHMLHEVAAGDLSPTDIVNPLRKMLRRVRLIEGEVSEIDLQARVVRYAMGALRQSRELTYDHLLLALGSETTYSDERCDAE